MRNLYCVCGRSASGKTATIKCMEEKYGIDRVRPWTTRDPRYEGEADYSFVTPEKFRAQTDIIGYGMYDGHEYGIPASELKNHDVYILELSGIKQLLAEYKDKPIQVIYFDALEGLCVDRMQTRGDSPASIQRRTALDRKAFCDALSYANYVFEVNYGASVEQNAKTVYEAICAHEVYSANQDLKDRFPNIEVCIFMCRDNDINSKPTYNWKCENVYSPEFANLEDAFQDACQYLDTPHLRVLNQIKATQKEAEYLLSVGKAALSLCHQYVQTGSEEFLDKFNALYPNVNTDYMYDGEDILLESSLTREQRDAVEEAFSATEYLSKKAAGLSMSVEDTENHNKGEGV